MNQAPQYHQPRSVTGSASLAQGSQGDHVGNIAQYRKCPAGSAYQAEYNRWYEIHQATKTKKPAHRFYLLTQYWKGRRLGILERDRHQCRVCKSTTRLHVHHKTYARYWNELDDDLVTLCSRCHTAVHDTGKISKIPKNVSELPEVVKTGTSRQKKKKVATKRVYARKADRIALMSEIASGSVAMPNKRPKGFCRRDWERFVKEYKLRN